MSKTDAELVEQLYRAMVPLVQSFSARQVDAQESLKKLLVSSRRAFCAAGIRLLASSAESEGTRYLAHLLSDERLLNASLVDTGSCRVEDAIAAARAAVAAGIQLQNGLEWALNVALQERPSFQGAASILRILDLLAATSGPDCWSSCQLELMAYPDKKVRSRAALLIGRAMRNPTWLSRRSMDRDARVQANAVEAMWNLPAADARPLLAAAAKCRNNRVVANALLGLHRCGDSTALPRLLKMAQHTDAAFRLSAIWAIGQTGDPRFIPFLMQGFKESEGKIRLAITRALSQIRRREKAAAEAGPLDLRLVQVSSRIDTPRQIVFTAYPKNGVDLNGLKPSDLAVFEGDTLIETYDFKTSAKPDVALIGFVVPRFLDSTDPEAHAWADGLKRCLAIRRPLDLWRIDRYSIERSVEAAAPLEESNLPYDDALLNNELKMRHGFFSDSERIRKALASIVPRERASLDAAKALDRQCDAIGKHSGKRHLILLLNQASLAELQAHATSGRLLTHLQAASVVLHCVATRSDSGWDELRKLCTSAGEHTFTDTTIQALPDALETIYLSLLARFVVTYQGPANVGSGVGTIKVTCDQGCGSVEFSLGAEVTPDTRPKPDTRGKPDTGAETEREAEPDPQPA